MSVYRSVSKSVVKSVHSSLKVPAALSGGATSLPLDSFTPSAVYSTRKTRTAYTGNCMLVRRSSDNTTQAIGFSGNQLDTAALLSFVGGGNGFVRTWYDQSGNGYDATQTTNANQPQIVSSGSLVTLNSGVPAVLFIAASSTKLQTAATIANVASASAWTALATTNVTSFETGNAGTGVNAQLIADAGAYFAPIGIARNTSFYGDLSSYQYTGTDRSVTVPAASVQDLILSARLSGGTLSAFLNGTKLSTTTSPAIAVTTGLVHLGVNYNNSAKYNGKAAEIVMFGTALSDGDVDFIAGEMGSYASVAWKPSKVYLAEGDSITLGNYTGGTSYVSLVAADASVGGLFTKVLNYSKGSSVVVSAVNRGSAVDAQFPSVRGVLSVMLGVNDHFAGVSTSTFLTDYAAYCDARRAAGWKVIVCEILPSTDPGMDTWRATVNAAISGWVGTHADAYCSWSASIKADADAADTNKYSDGVHPTLATQAIMKADIAPIIASLA